MLASGLPLFRSSSSKPKRLTNVLLAENQETEPEPLDSPDASFDDVEVFLAVNNIQADNDEAASESEAAGALAVSWTERGEINRLQKTRQFGTTMECLETGL